MYVYAMQCLLDKYLLLIIYYKKIKTNLLYYMPNFSIYLDLEAKHL